MNRDPSPLDLDLVRPLVEAALAEDVGSGDVTTLATVPEEQTAQGEFLVKEDGVLCGLAVAGLVFSRVDPGLVFEADAMDGDPVRVGQVVARVRGGARGILTGERTALNFLQHLSGIATAAARAVNAVAGSGVQILDTRKTVPGMRVLAKYAARSGGAANHRQGLFDMILIKENHIIAAGGIATAIRRARERYPELPLEVEVTDLDELREALGAGPDRILLDNFDPSAVERAVGWVREHAGETGASVPEIELSGGISAETAKARAVSGVDYLSIGAITHSAKALDISLELRLSGQGRG